MTTSLSSSSATAAVSTSARDASPAAPNVADILDLETCSCRTSVLACTRIGSRCAPCRNSRAAALAAPPLSPARPRAPWPAAPRAAPLCRALESGTVCLLPTCKSTGTRKASCSPGPAAAASAPPARCAARADDALSPPYSFFSRVPLGLGCRRRQGAAQAGRDYGSRIALCLLAPDFRAANCLQYKIRFTGSPFLPPPFETEEPSTL